MTILLIGGTGQIGSAVAENLAPGTKGVRVLTQHPERAKLPAGGGPVKGDVLDMDGMRAALEGVDTLFVLNPVVADELTRALLTLRLAKDAGIKGIVYFSMVQADGMADTPHAAAKYAAERMIERFDLPATVLRANCFYQNDVQVKEPLVRDGVYAMPLGEIGVSMVDTRDIAEVAAAELVRRDEASEPLPRDLIELSGPEELTGTSVARIWSEVLGRQIAYGGDDTGPFEKQAAANMPSAMALDLALMFRGFQRDGMSASPGAVERMTSLIGHPPRTYRAFAEEMATSWRTA